nr:putative DNA dependent RNA polymerase A subunit [Siniperca chuatsi ranavirus]
MMVLIEVMRAVVVQSPEGLVKMLKLSSWLVSFTETVSFESTVTFGVVGAWVEDWQFAAVRNRHEIIRKVVCMVFVYIYALRKFLNTTITQTMFTSDSCQVEELGFGLCSAAEILATSVAEITKPCLRVELGSVYDPRLGYAGEPAEGYACPTCEEDASNCPGHFGHIELGAPVIVFYKEAVAWLKKCCHGCGKTAPGPKSASLTVSSVCPDCGTQHPAVRLLNAQDPTSVSLAGKRKNCAQYPITPEDALLILDKISDASVDKILGRGAGSHKRFHPRRLVMTRFPVLPPCCRPSARQWPEGGVQDDNLSVFIAQIVKLNNKLKALPPNDPGIAAAAAQLRLKILCFVDNSKGKAMHTTNRKPMVGIKERISKKGGLLRQNIMGKRRNQTGRSVVGPDGTLEVDQVGVPESIADNMSVPVAVTAFNMSYVSSLVAGGKVLALTRRDGTVCKPQEWLPEHGHVMLDAAGNECGEVNRPREAAKDPSVVAFKDPASGRVTEKPTPFSWPALEPGMVVDRRLVDGDVVALNRQPTLHRNSMLGMRVKRLPGKTIRLNLSVTGGFNMDFDGDEGNLYLPQGPQAVAETAELMNPKRVIVSARGPTAEVALVQDGVLGAHLMSLDPSSGTAHEFSSCVLEALGCQGWDVNALPRGKSPRDLLAMALPADFSLSTETLEIVNGRVTRGYFTKKSLRHVIKLVCLEYGGDVAGRLVDRVQFITNAWLAHRPFSVGYSDCLPVDRLACKAKVRETVSAKMREADAARDESAVSAALCGARDLGQSITCGSLAKDNRMAVMARAESKGDMFNLTQIAGLLGQQYVSGSRPGKETDAGRRTLPHYPRVWKRDQSEQKYESRGFIASSFLEGLNPRQVFFHAKSGREGMISTSQMTGVTGYAERKMVKLNEDMVTAYDGTVRDAMGNVVQFVYGGHGFDPQRCFQDGIPVNFQRLAARLGRGETPAVSCAEEAAGLLPSELCSGAPEPVRRALYAWHAENIAKGAKTHPCGDPVEWKKFVAKAYALAAVCPGEAVGVLCAQSIGAKQTQQTLDTFHKAGGWLDESGSVPFGELLSLSQKPKIRRCLLPLKISPDLPADIVRDVIGCQFVCRELRDLLAVQPLVPQVDRTAVLELDAEKCFALRISPADVAEAVAEKFPPPHFETRVKSFGVELVWNANCITDTLYNNIFSVTVGKTVGVHSYELVKDKLGVWTAVTRGTNLSAFLGHPLVDSERVRCDDVWDVYNTLGLAAAKKRLWELVTSCVGDSLHPSHVKLLTDRMMRRGKPTPIDRYTMRTCEVGPLSRAAFEESLEILTGAGCSAEREPCSGVGARIVAGLPVKVGTGCVDLLCSKSFFDPPSDYYYTD